MKWSLVPSVISAGIFINIFGKFHGALIFLAVELCCLASRIELWEISKKEEPREQK